MLFTCETGFRRFPFRNKELLDQWITAINRQNWTPSKSSVICSKHFYEMDFYPCQQRKQLRDTSIPTIFTCREDAEPYSFLEILNASDLSSEAADSSNVNHPYKCLHSAFKKEFNNRVIWFLGSVIIRYYQSRGFNVSFRELRKVFRK